MILEKMRSNLREWRIERLKVVAQHHLCREAQRSSVRDKRVSGSDLATNLLRSLEKVVILIVCANPKPGNRICLEQSERSVS